MKSDDDTLDAPGEPEEDVEVIELPAHPRPKKRKINLDFMDCADDSLVPASRWSGARRPKHQQQRRIWDLPCPMKTGLPEPPVPDYAPVSMFAGS